MLGTVLMIPNPSDPISDEQAPTDRHHTDTKVVYRRYASLFFITSISPGDNELLTLEAVHRYVECLDKFFGSVSIFRAVEDA